MFSHWHYAGAEVPQNQKELDEYNEQYDSEGTIRERYDGETIGRPTDDYHHGGSEDEYSSSRGLVHEDLFLSPTPEWREKRHMRMRKTERGKMTPDLIHEKELCELASICENLSECIEFLKSKERWSILPGDETQIERINKTRDYISRLTKRLEEYECLLSDT